MKIVVGLVLVFLVSPSYQQQQVTCDLTTPGDNSGVICVSETHFILNADDDHTYNSMPCPDGTKCADVPEICSATADALCPNTNPNQLGTCNKCRVADKDKTHKVCVSKTEYAICNGETLLKLNYTCPPATPNCKYSDIASPICTTSIQDLDCPANNSTTPTDPQAPGATTPSTPFDCVEEGLFAYTNDATCLHYYKCAVNPAGGFIKQDFECAAGGYKFNPYNKRCESNYKCVP